jgi:hypothetical protein
LELQSQLVDVLVCRNQWNLCRYVCEREREREKERERERCGRVYTEREREKEIFTT